MGQILKVTCRKCEKSENLYIGGGLADCESETIISAMSEPQKKALQDAINLGAKGLQINRIPCVCQSCGGFYSASKVSYFFEKEKKTMSMWSRCPFCNSGRKNTIKKGNIPLCKICGEKIDTEEIGLWD